MSEMAGMHCRRGKDANYDVRTRIVCRMRAGWQRAGTSRLEGEQHKAPSAMKSLPSRFSGFCASPANCAAAAKPEAEGGVVKAENGRKWAE
eukprot:3472246-Rhodomonas_salina.1